MKTNQLKLLGAALLAAGLAPASTQALSIDAVKTAIAGGYHFDFWINNDGPVDLAIVSIINAPLNDPLIGSTLTAPADYLASYDSGLGFVDFIEGAMAFAAGTVTGGFSFDSALGPPDFFTLFEALDINGDLLVGTINYRGAVPDAGGALLYACLGLFGLGLCQRRLAPASV